MNKYFPTIGLEIHTELNTKSKMFSNSLNDVNAPINTNINEIDLGLPGTLPSVNKEAVIKAIRLAKALKMEIDSLLKFDRKNYFYQDLPKGYQITQQYRPIGKNGELEGVLIERIHLEEDTAKQILIDNKVCLDYNRAGVPLIEIVTKPVIHSSKQAVDFLSALRNVLIFANISDGKMEEGSLRVDINISISKENSSELGTKVEIKNVNSFANTSQAIEFEIKRQSDLLDSGQNVAQETRRWDDVSQETKFMRLKSNDIDYHYFPEPNINAIDISNLINEISVPELPSEIKNKLIALSIPNNIIEQLINNIDALKAFTYLSNKIKNYTSIITWLLIELPPLLKQTNKSYATISQSFLDHIIELVGLIDNQTINGKQAKTIFEQMYLNNKKPSQLVNDLGFKQIVDEQHIRQQLQEIINANKDMVSQYLTRPERVEKMFIGLLMKQTKGNANPIIATKILRELLK